MNKTFLYLFVFLLAISLVFAASDDAGAKPSDTGASNVSGNADAGIANGSGNEHQVTTTAMNQGQETKLQVQTNSKFGTTLMAGNSEAKTKMNLTQSQDGKIYAHLSNGMNAEIKVMPDTASQKALDVLGAKCQDTGCNIELKEVGKGNQSQVAYQVQAEKQVKFLGLFKAQMRVEADVNAETGEVIKTRHSWWRFLAKKNLEK